MYKPCFNLGMITKDDKHNAQGLFFCLGNLSVELVNYSNSTGQPEAVIASDS